MSPNERLQHLFHPWTSFLIVPLFALANAGVEIDVARLRSAATSPITIGIVAGLVVGKVVGIGSASWLANRVGGLPLTISWPLLLGTSTVAGIGFTVSLLIAGITFDGEQLVEAKLGILAASVLATLLSWVAFRVIARGSAGFGRAAGSRRSSRTCPTRSTPTSTTCTGASTPPSCSSSTATSSAPIASMPARSAADLEASFGDQLAFVFRHLPLDDVHEHARLAAEAAEAAGAQGRFWEMHDLLFRHQDALQEADLAAYAGTLGLDVDRFVRDLDGRRHALRVQRDVDSAEDSGAAGTPTFFVNGHRHAGGSDLASLTDALRRTAGLAVGR